MLDQFICAYLYCLLKVCSGLKKGEKLVSNGLDSPEAEAFLQTVFEVGRRFKIMNPSKMRSSYGKLMYMLQVRNI